MRTTSAAVLCALAITACYEPAEIVIPPAPPPPASPPAPPTPPSDTQLVARESGLELRWRTGGMLALHNVGDEPASVGSRVDGYLHPRLGWSLETDAGWQPLDDMGCGNSRFERGPLRPGQSFRVADPSMLGTIAVHPARYRLRIEGERGDEPLVFEAELTFGAGTPQNWDSVPWDPDATPTAVDTRRRWTIAAGESATGVVRAGESVVHGFDTESPVRVYLVVSTSCEPPSTGCESSGLRVRLEDRYEPPPRLIAAGPPVARPPTGPSMWQVQRFDAELGGPGYGNIHLQAVGRRPVRYVLELYTQRTPDRTWRERWPL